MKRILILFSLFLLVAVTSNAQVDVTFKVDMNIKAAEGDFTAATDRVSLRGDLNDWGETEMTDGDADGVYEVTLQLDAGTYNFKFYFNNGEDQWESDPNRTVDVANDPIELGTFFFEGRTAYTGVTSSVTFNADMRLPINQGSVTPGVTNVYVAGNFTGWGDGAALMDDSDNDSTYSVTIDTLTSGTLLQYKFIYSDGAASDGSWEDDPNKLYGVVDGENEVTRFWNNVNPNVQLANGSIFFSVDMSVMAEVGIYDAVNDSVQVRGGFNSWNDSEPDRTFMNQDFLNPNLWSLNVTFNQVEVNSTQSYKFFVNKADTNDLWTDGWERPSSKGGGNRGIDFEGIDNQDGGVLYFDDIHPDWVIPEGTTVEITFSVDMTPAADAGLQAVPFEVGDRLWWINEQPTFTRMMEWEDSDTMQVLELTDDDSDMIYTGTLSVSGPAFNSFVYRYGYVKASSGEWIQEPEGFGDFAYRVRYISQTSARTFNSPYNAPQDTWTNSEDKSDQVEEGPGGLTDVEALDELPDQYSLEQNYPNPFNPTTTIKFSIPATDLVTLKVYNVLGQEVATVLNEVMNVGAYKVDFDASTLSSGVYVYSIRSGNFVSSKKMILLK